MDSIPATLSDRVEILSPTTKPLHNDNIPSSPGCHPEGAPQRGEGASSSPQMEERIEVRRDLDPLPYLEKLSAATGDPTIRFNKILIHSSYDPVKEGRSFAKSVRPGSRVCLYGFGLGYHVQSLLNQIGPNGRLMVIELNPDLLSAALHLRDQTEVFSDSRLHLIFGREEIVVSREISERMAEWTRSSSTASAPLEVLFHAPSFKCIPANFPSLTNALEVLLMERRFPAVLGDLESQNYSFNQDMVRKSRGINSLAGTHRGQPGILVSAGPSLDDLLPYLHHITQSAIIACVDTALPILAREGIHPQYVFTLDPQEESFLSFRDNLENLFKLIYTPTAHTKIISCFQGEKFVVFKQGHSLYQNLELQMEEKGTTKAGGSVSCLGLDCLIQLGCDPIFLIGQDCAYSGQRTYSRYSDMNVQLLDRIPESDTLAKAHVDKAAMKKQIRIKGNFGSMVSTSQSMYSYKRTIEEIAMQHAGTQIYNLSSHGAEIENIIPLNSVNEFANKLRVGTTEVRSKGTQKKLFNRKGAKDAEKTLKNILDFGFFAIFASLR